MVMTDDQRQDEAQRLSGQLLLDAQRRPGGLPISQCLNDLALAARPLRAAVGLRREWEEDGADSERAGIFPRVEPKPLFLAHAE